MADTVTLYIDGQAYQVPKGANLVDAAKLHHIPIPVFCYHPKLKPVGMCRMCLVELGNLSINRETSQPDLDENGQPVFKWLPKLQTACTQTVTDGMAIRTTTQKVIEGRDDILEFLLTSHPLDCPVCDKGGECPLQNLTMAYGPGNSRFIFDDKMRLAKHVPLGELIFLDRERCIQCARCPRFCDEVVGDDVLAFHERGRRLQIVTVSEPPFNSKFSGNTTDICPVGALTTADFRFGARPWEMDEVPTICPHCPVGCNLSASTRIDRDFGGKKMIKRIMPRQNEDVNEIWICDKGRFGHHHSRVNERLETPMVKRDGQWVPIDWATAYQEIAAKLQMHRNHTGVVAGPSLSNEDLWELRKVAGLSSDDAKRGFWPATVTGLEQVTQAGVGVGTRIQDMGRDSAILVIASDFEEEAPIWWLQVKQAADRGAIVAVANARPTKLDQYAKVVIRYQYGEAVNILNSIAARARSSKKTDKALIGARVDGYEDLGAGLKKVKPSETLVEAADKLLEAKNLIIFAGAEGLSLEEHGELMQAAANLLIITGHTARPNNGLVGVWPGANIQGAMDMGFSAEATRDWLDNPPSMWGIAGANPAAEDARFSAALDKADYVVVTSLFMTETADKADLVLPSQSFAEREGTFTNGMRRVQRFYTAQGVVGEALPDWKIFAHIGEQMGGEKPRISAAAVMREITQKVLRYAEMSYSNLAQVTEQFPDVGGDDLYYGGTAYTNHGGLGVMWPTNAENERYRFTVRPVKTESTKAAGLLVVPVDVLYDRDMLFEPSQLMHLRIPEPYAELNQADAAQLGINNGELIVITVGEQHIEVTARVDGKAPVGALLLPRQVAKTPIPTLPTIGTVQKLQE